MYSDPNHPERQQEEPHKWIKHQRDERHRPAKHKQHTPEEESYHRSSRALSDIKYVCLRARVPAIYAAKCFLRNSSVRAFASCQTGPSKPWPAQDRKSTRLNSSHSQISYAVFCLKKKKNKEHEAKFLSYCNCSPYSVYDLD